MSYCRKHDPLLRAGVLHCTSCGSASYPTDAAWVDETKILATFPPPCGNDRTKPMVIDVTRLDPLPEGFDPELYTRNRSCLGVTKDGHPCRAKASLGSLYCHQHADQGRKTR